MVEHQRALPDLAGAQATHPPEKGGPLTGGFSYRHHNMYGRHRGGTEYHMPK